jgi:hypothetical protein
MFEEDKDGKDETDTIKAVNENTTLDDVLKEMKKVVENINALQNVFSNAYGGNIFYECNGIGGLKCFSFIK